MLSAPLTPALPPLPVSLAQYYGFCCCSDFRSRNCLLVLPYTLFSIATSNLVGRHRSQFPFCRFSHNLLSLCRIHMMITMIVFRSTMLTSLFGFMKVLFMFLIPNIAVKTIFFFSTIFCDMRCRYTTRFSLKSLPFEFHLLVLSGRREVTGNDHRQRIGVDRYYFAGLNSDWIIFVSLVEAIGQT